MASFRFNFEEETSIKENHAEDSERSSCKLVTVREAKEVAVQSGLILPPNNEVEETVLCKGEVVFRHVRASYVERKLKGVDKSDIIGASERNTDLIPCEYEGGVKLWECAVDLVEFLLETGVNFESSSVLEIGCGVGLPGITALLKGASVHFQDYNDEVIEHVTIPNVLLNQHRTTQSCPSTTANRTLCTNFPTQTNRNFPEVCRFFAGDWESLRDIINPSQSEEQKYDIILTSETIYSADSHEKLYNLMKGLLKKQHGVAYIAAKTYYFGVGGGTRMFEELVRSDGTFDISACRVYNDGVQREILCMRYKTEK